MLQKEIKAPVKQGQKIGEAKYYLNGEEIGSVDILTTEAVDEISYKSAMKDTAEQFLL